MTANLGPAPFVLSGTQILASFVASAQQFFGRAARVYFYLNVVTAAISNLTTITVKLQYRYNDGTTVTTYVDLPTDKGDKGTQPGTNETSHAYTVVANQTKDFAPFFLDNPFGLLDVTINVQANAPGIAGDVVTIRAVLA